MKDMNHVVLLGNLGADPDVRNTASGSPVVNLKVATNKNRKVDGEWKKETEWHRVTAWGETNARVAEGLAKGSRVLVQGENRTRKWQTQDGQERYTTEVVAYSLGSQERQEGGGQYSKKKDHYSPGADQDLNDDIAF